MKCFNHPENEAVGSCKHCFRGVCPQCARDSGVGLACSEACAGEVKAVHALVERNKKLIAFAPKPHFRSAVMLTLMAATSRVRTVFGITFPFGLHDYLWCGAFVRSCVRAN